MDRQAVHEQWERDRAVFHTLLASATTGELRQPSRGTRWTNQQLSASTPVAHVTNAGP
jgi:hypothetical protein